MIRNVEVFSDRLAESPAHAFKNLANWVSDQIGVDHPIRQILVHYRTGPRMLSDWAYSTRHRMIIRTRGFWSREPFRQPTPKAVDRSGIVTMTETEAVVFMTAWRFIATTVYATRQSLHTRSFRVVSLFRDDAEELVNDWFCPPQEKE